MTYFVIAGIVVAILMIAAEATIYYYIWALIVFAIAAAWYYIFVYLKFKYETPPTSSEITGGITKLELLKHNVVGVKPLVDEKPFARNQMIIYQALNYTFLEHGVVFSGKVSEFIESGVKAGVEESALRNGFDSLANSGYIELVGDTFVPTQLYIDMFH